MNPIRPMFVALFLGAIAASPLPYSGPVHAQGRLVEREVTRYTVRPGDTLSSISRAAGVPLNVLRELNPDIDPRLLRTGQTIYLPARAAAISALTIDLDSYRGRIDEDVAISASGFPPRTPLRVLAGNGPYRLEVVDSVRADRRGRVELEVELPEWVRPGSQIYFGLQSRDGRYRVVARPYKVVGNRPKSNPNRIEISGTLTREGVECQTMRGDDGRTYSLLGDTRGYRSGDRVWIEGRVAEMSICQQGIAVEVRRITQAE